jgi:hypothetical protein
MTDNIKPSCLKFELIAKMATPDFVAVTNPPCFMACLNKLNETEWMGKEPKSCKIKHFEQRKNKSIGQIAEFDIFVEYKPEGCITFNRGGFWYDGYKAKHIDVKDGVPLNGKGQSLPVGEYPVIFGWDIIETFDFNQCNFGKFISEE